MTIYVDNFGFKATVWNPWSGRHVTSKWYHLISDHLSWDELHRFADGLGLKREYFQLGVDKNTSVYNPGHDHYDLTVGKRRQAIKLGATPVDVYELGQLIMAKTKLWHALVDLRAQELRGLDVGTTRIHHTS